MKNYTKYKIIQFVKKVLKYIEPIPRIIEEKTVPIMEVNGEIQLIDRIDDNLIKEELAHKIANELLKVNGIEFDLSQKNIYQGLTRYKSKAKLTYINPK